MRKIIGKEDISKEATRKIIGKEDISKIAINGVDINLQTTYQWRKHLNKIIGVISQQTILLEEATSKRINFKEACLQ
jgi:hypothetical protein